MIDEIPQQGNYIPPYTAISLTKIDQLQEKNSPGHIRFERLPNTSTVAPNQIKLELHLILFINMFLTECTETSINAINGLS